MNEKVEQEAVNPDELSAMVMTCYFTFNYIILVAWWTLYTGICFGCLFYHEYYYQPNPQDIKNVLIEEAKQELCNAFHCTNFVVPRKQIKKKVEFWIQNVRKLDRQSQESIFITTERWGLTLLHLACRFRLEKVALLMMESMSEESIHKQTSTGMTALSLCCRDRGRMYTVFFAILQRTTQEKYLFEPNNLHMVIIRKDKRKIQALIDRATEDGWFHQVGFNHTPIELTWNDPKMVRFGCDILLKTKHESSMYFNNNIQRQHYLEVCSHHRCRIPNDCYNKIYCAMEKRYNRYTWYLQRCTQFLIPRVGEDMTRVVVSYLQISLPSGYMLRNT